MEYLIGVILSVAVAGFVAFTGMDKDRAIYPVLLIVIAAYYVLFAVMGGGSRTLIIEIAAASLFAFLAVLGFKRNLWFAAAGIVGHGVFDLVHHVLIENQGVPLWWPGFCMAFDVIFGAWLALCLVSRRARP